LLDSREWQRNKTFQSLGRDSVHSSPARGKSPRWASCFNPSVGILFIQALVSVLVMIVVLPGFNPSVGILFIQAPYSFRWGGEDLCFNPSVGILFIQANYNFDAESSFWVVSIPRSGFCSFKLLSNQYNRQSSNCFNPSVGILFIQAYIPGISADVIGRFQSLGRDSVHSSWKMMHRQ